MQPITGEHLVSPDGTVNLGTYGLVYVAGMTLEEAKQAIEDATGQATWTSPQVSVSVFAYNSKVYYVITKGPARATWWPGCRSPATRRCWTRSRRSTA